MNNGLGNGTISPIVLAVSIAGAVFAPSANVNVTVVPATGESLIVFMMHRRSQAQTHFPH